MANEIRALILGGNRFSFHRLERVGPVLAETLAPIGVDAEVTTDREALTDLGAYDVLVDYTTDSTLTDEQLDGLLSFVEDGNGYAGIHCASDLTITAEGHRDEPVPELRELIGGHFRSHPDQGTFAVNVVYSHHPVSAGLDDFTVWDEPYVVDYDEEVAVLARMDHPELEDVPVSWVKSHGDGRVFYCSLGHDYPSLVTDGTQELLRSGVRWAALG